MISAIVLEQTFPNGGGKKKKSRTVQVGTACINHPSIVRSKDGRERVSLLFELPFVLACLLPTAIVIVVNGFCTRKSSFSSYREIHAAKFNSSPPLPPNRRRKHSFSSRMESRSRERGAREDWWKGVGAVDRDEGRKVEGVRDGKKSSRNPGSAPLRHRKRCNEVSTHGATEAMNRYHRDMRAYNHTSLR